MNELRLDLRDAVRSMRRNPGFTATIVLILALGIGANTALFAIVNAVLLRPLPYPQSERIVSVSSAAGGMEVLDVNTIRLLLSERSPSFDALAAYETDGANLTGGAEPERVEGGNVSQDFFRVMGVHPVLGREFSNDDSRNGGPPVVILAHSLWQRDFGGDPEIIGSTVKLDDQSYAVVGVMPAGFQYPRNAEYWLPLELPSPAPGTFYYESFIGRLRSGGSLDGARTEIITLLHAHEAELPHNGGIHDISAMSLHDRTYGDLRPTLLVLLATVGCVLLIACANVASLLLARVAERRREIAVRAALGAGRARLVRQLLVESLLIAMLGGVLGLVVAINAFDLTTALGPSRLTQLPSLTLDGRVVLFAFAVSLFTGVLFGVVPAFAIAHADIHGALKNGSQNTSWDSGSGSARRILVMAQLTIAVVLLVGAGLLAKSFVRFESIDSGFDAAGVLTASVTLPNARYADPTAIKTFFQDVLERVRATPGVEAATQYDIVPLGGSSMVRTRTTDASGAIHQSPLIAVGHVGTGYFRTFGIPLLAGRDMSEMDNATAPRVAIVNESMARAFFADESALGRQLSIGARKPYTIVGVVADVRVATASAASPPAVYFPLLQSGSSRSASIALRTRSDPLMLIPALRRAVRSVDPEQPVSQIRTMNEVLDEFMAPRRFNVTLLGTFAALALTLAATGLYGLTTYLVTQRTHEIGVRMALGAERHEVLTLVLQQGMRPTLVGVVIGIVAALGLTRLLSSMLFRVEARDPVIFTAVPLVLIGVATLATIIPARRASRVDPLIALRAE